MLKINRITNEIILDVSGEKRTLWKILLKRENLTQDHFQTRTKNCHGSWCFTVVAFLGIRIRKKFEEREMKEKKKIQIKIFFARQGRIWDFKRSKKIDLGQNQMKENSCFKPVFGNDDDNDERKHREY